MSLLKVSSTTGTKETKRNEDSGIQSSTLLDLIQTEQGWAETALLFKLSVIHGREQFVYKIRGATGPESS